MGMSSSKNEDIRQIATFDDQAIPLATALTNADSLPVTKSENEGLRIIAAFEDIAQPLPPTPVVSLPKEVLDQKPASNRDATIEIACVLLHNDQVNEDLANAVLRSLAEHFGTARQDGMYSCPDWSMNRLVQKMHWSRWGRLFERVILDLYHERSACVRAAVGGLYGYLTDYTGERSDPEFKIWVRKQVDELCLAEGKEAVAAALRLWPTANYGFPGDDSEMVERLVRRLLEMLGHGPHAAHAAAGLLFYLQDPLEVGPFRRFGAWRPSADEVGRLVRFLTGTRAEPEGSGRFALGIITAHPQEIDLKPIIERLQARDLEGSILRNCLAEATGWQGDEVTLSEVIACLSKGEGLSSVLTLPVSLDYPWDRVLVSRDLDGTQPWCPEDLYDPIQLAYKTETVTAGRFKYPTSELSMRLPSVISRLGKNLCN